MKTAIVIPARLESSRFPEKMIAQVTKEHCLIQRVHHWCCCWHPQEDVFVATDSKRIASLFPKDKAIITSPECSNGTERVAEAANQPLLDSYDAIINVQGDMIDVPPVIEDLKNGLQNFPVVTVWSDISDDDRSNLNSVKVIRSSSLAIWFGRGISGYGDHHYGIYAYTKWALAAYKKLPVYDGELEESLEQLRWIYNNIPVGLVYNDSPCAEINTREDLKRWQLTHQS